MSFKRLFILLALMMLCTTTVYADVPVLGGQIGVLQMATDVAHQALGTANLTNNAAIIGQVQTGGPGSWAIGTAEDMRIWLQQGFNTYAWTGKGIQSSTAAADGNVYTGINWSTGQAYLDFVAGPLGINTFHGVVVKPDDMLLSYGYYGDSNFDGVVTDADYGYINYAYACAAGGGTIADFNSAYGTSYTALGSILGDADYSGKTDDSDYGFINYTYGVNAYGLLNPAYITGSSAGGQTSTVPEPSVMILLMGLLAFSGFKFRSRFFHN